MGTAKRKGKAKIGRPSKLTPALSARLCKLLAAGWFLDHAAAEVGVSRKVVYEWLAAAEKKTATPEQKAFRDAHERARAKGERVYLGRIQRKAAPLTSVAGMRVESGDWKADAWMLERLNPGRYKPTTRTEVTGADGGPVELKDAAARVAGRIARLAAALGESEAATGDSTE